MAESFHATKGQILTGSFAAVSAITAILGSWYVVRDAQKTSVHGVEMATQAELGEVKADIKVLNVTSAQHSKNYEALHATITLVQQEMNKTYLEIINKLIGGKAAVFLPVADIDGLEKLREDLLNNAPQPSQRELKIIQELNGLTTKEKLGELTEEEAVHKGKLEDELSNLKQKQILEGLRRSRGTIDCSRCKEICGPII